VLESDVVLPRVRLASEVKVCHRLRRFFPPPPVFPGQHCGAQALDSSLDEFAVPFTLAELLPTAQTWEPSAADIGRLLAAEIVEEALVRGRR
jgi:hypothetical protein